MQKKKQFITHFIKVFVPFLSVLLLSLSFSIQVKADDDDPFDVTNPWGFTNPMSPNNPNSPTNPMNWDDDDREHNDTSTEDSINNELPSETHAREKREEKQNQKEQDEAMNSPINMFAFFGLILICLIILTWIFIWLERSNENGRTDVKILAC